MLAIEKVICDAGAKTYQEGLKSVRELVGWYQAQSPTVQPILQAVAECFRPRLLTPFQALHHPSCNGPTSLPVAPGLYKADPTP